MPLQKRTYQYSRLFGLIEHEMMSSAGNVSPLHVRTYLVNLLEERWRQAWTMFSTEDQGWTGDALPARQGMHRRALSIHATVDLVYPCAAW